MLPLDARLAYYHPNSGSFRDQRASSPSLRLTKRVIAATAAASLVPTLSKESGARFGEVPRALG